MSFRLPAMIAAFCAILLLAGYAQVQGSELEFKARLTGDQEVPPVLTNTTGRFKIEFDDPVTMGEFRLRIDDGVRITQAHLHCAPVGFNGPIIVFLAGFHDRGWDVDGRWVDNATVTDANVVDPACGATLAEIVQQIRAGNVYVNAHSVEFPGGVVRGQLMMDED